MRDVAVAAGLLVADLRLIFGPRLHAVGVYGEQAGPAADAAPDPGAPLHTFAHVESIALDDLRACASRADRWATKGLAAPLLLAGDEFARSLDAFPLEYGAIIADHRVVFGRDPFDGLQVRADDLRRACEVQAKSHLLHLREGFIETGGGGADLAALIAASAQPFRSLLQHVARLQGQDPADGDALVRFGGSIGLSIEAVRVVLALRGPRDLGPVDAGQLFPAYLDAAERLARFVDTWTAR